MTADDGIDQTELYGCRRQQRGNDVAGVSASAIVQILVGQRQHANQRVEAKCIACRFVRSVLGKNDADVGVEPGSRNPAAVQDAIGRERRLVRCVGQIDDVVGTAVWSNEPVAKQVAQCINVAILRP